ncbi:MAG: hypothetical protein AB2805_14285 [Candidatus Thiodiazotropha sp.]
MSINVKSIYSGSHKYNSYSPEVSCLISQTSIEDLNITLFLSPSVNEFAPRSGPQCPEDVRIYVNKFDITESFIDELVRNVQLADPAKIQEQYWRGVKAYLNVMNATGEYEEELVGEEEKAEQIARSGQWKDLFSSLGNRSIGWLGTLHPLCYAYSYIQLNPVSIRQAWEHYVNSSNTNLSKKLADLPIKKITFSHGRASFDTNSTSSHSVPSGNITYLIETTSRNPLEKPLTRILSRMRSIEMGLENLRVQYSEPTLTKAEQISTDVIRMSESMSERIDQLKETVERIG